VNRIVVATTSDDFGRRVQLAVSADSVELLPMTDGDTAAQRRRREDPSSVDPARLLLELTAGGIPDVVVFGPGIPTEAAVTVASFIDGMHKGTSIVLATAVGADDWLEAMRAGIRDVVPPDADVAELRAVLERASAAATARRLAASTSDAASPRGRVIPIVSPKGGSGKTTIATNLAVGLARLAPHQTVIVDLDLQFGDVASALHLTPEQGLADAVDVIGLDAMALKTFLTPHPTGLYALCGSDSPAAADGVTGDDVTKLLGLLAEEFRYVVVDTAPGITEHTLRALDEASDAVMICTMDVPSIRGLYKERQILRDLSLTRMTEHVVLNFADKNSGLTVKDVEGVIGTDVDVVLPRSSAVTLSTNQGVPLLQSGTRDAATKELQQLVARFQIQLQKAAGRQPRHRALAR